MSLPQYYLDVTHHALTLGIFGVFFYRPRMTLHHWYWWMALILLHVAGSAQLTGTAMHATKQWVLAVMTNHHECVHRNRSKEQLVPNCNIHTRLCMPCLHMSLSLMAVCACGWMGVGSSEEGWYRSGTRGRLGTSQGQPFSTRK